MNSVRDTLAGGFPHSDIHGSMLVCELPVAFRTLRRPSSPVIAKASTTCTSSLDPITLSPGSPGTLRRQATATRACSGTTAGSQAVPENAITTHVPLRLLGAEHFTSPKLLKIQTASTRKPISKCTHLDIHSQRSWWR